jgi:hypothetical protein
MDTESDHASKSNKQIIIEEECTLSDESDDSLKELDKLVS